MNTLTNKITLSGEESIAFVNSLYRPSNECIQQSKERLGLIEKKIIITETKDGFEAEIKDLDLSFLEKQHEDRKLSREFTRYDNLDITNEKIRKDLTFNYNGKEYEYSYGKDPQLNNNFTLLYQINKTKDEVLRIYDNNSTINEKYLDENVIDKNFFEVLKQNNLLDKTENYENFKSLNEKIDIYAKVGMSDISFSYNKNNFHYSMHQGKFGTSSICLNPINQIIYEKTTKDFVGTTINVIKYDSRYLNKKMFAALKNENLKDFRNQSYEDFCKNATDISKENVVNKSFDER